jgi:hypothetical protein
VDKLKRATEPRTASSIGSRSFTEKASAGPGVAGARLAPPPPFHASARPTSTSAPSTPTTSGWSTSRASPGSAEPANT